MSGGSHAPSHAPRPQTEYKLPTAGDISRDCALAEKLNKLHKPSHSEPSEGDEGFIVASVVRYPAYKLTDLCSTVYVFDRTRPLDASVEKKKKGFSLMNVEVPHDIMMRIWPNGILMALSVSKAFTKMVLGEKNTDGTMKAKGFAREITLQMGTLTPYLQVVMQGSMKDVVKACFMPNSFRAIPWVLQIDRNGKYIYEHSTDFKPADSPVRNFAKKIGHLGFHVKAYGFSGQQIFADAFEAPEATPLSDASRYVHHWDNTVDAGSFTRRQQAYFTTLFEMLESEVYNGVGPGILSMKVQMEEYTDWVHFTDLLQKPRDTGLEEEYEKRVKEEGAFLTRNLAKTELTLRLTCGYQWPGDTFEQVLRGWTSVFEKNKTSLKEMVLKFVLYGPNEGKGGKNLMDTHLEELVHSITDNSKTLASFRLVFEDDLFENHTLRNLPVNHPDAQFNDGRRGIKRGWFLSAVFRGLMNALYPNSRRLKHLRLDCPWKNVDSLVCFLARLFNLKEHIEELELYIPQVGIQADNKYLKEMNDTAMMLVTESSVIKSLTIHTSFNIAVDLTTEVVVIMEPVDHIDVCFANAAAHCKGKDVKFQVNVIPDHERIFLGD